MKKIIALLIAAALMLSLIGCHKSAVNNTPKEEPPLVVSENDKNTNTNEEETKKEELKQEENKNKDDIQSEIKYPDPNSKVPPPIEVKDKKVLDTLKAEKFYASIPSYNYFKYYDLKLERRADLDQAVNDLLKKQITNTSTWILLTGTQFTATVESYEAYTLEEQWDAFKKGGLCVIPKIKITNFKSQNIPSSKYQEVINTILPDKVLNIKFITDKTLLYQGPGKGFPYAYMIKNKLILIDELLKYVPYDSPEIKYILNVPDYKIIYSFETAGKVTVKESLYVPFYEEGTIILIDDNFNPLFWVKYRFEGDEKVVREKTRESNAKEFIQWAKDNLK
ncbi:MAG: hypothetical protein ACPLSX_00700 [Arcobacter sp.]